jgi:beta-lactamase superfamily II metal-dependent hydrolase
MNAGSRVSAIIEVPAGITVLIDPGPHETARALIAYVKSLNIPKIDHVLIPQIDTLDLLALETLTASIPIANVYYNQSPPLAPAVQDVIVTLKRRGIKVRTLARHQYVPLRKAEIVVLNPNPFQADAGNSLAVKLIYGKTAFLFLGDASRAVQDELIDVYQSGLEAQAAVLPWSGILSPRFQEFLKGRLSIRVGFTAILQSDGKHVINAGPIPSPSRNS